MRSAEEWRRIFPPLSVGMLIRSEGQDLRIAASTLPNEPSPAIWDDYIVAVVVHLTSAVRDPQMQNLVVDSVHRAGGNAVISYLYTVQGELPGQPLQNDFAAIAIPKAEYGRVQLVENRRASFDLCPDRPRGDCSQAPLPTAAAATATGAAEAESLPAATAPPRLLRGGDRDAPGFPQATLPALGHAVLDAGWLSSFLRNDAGSAMQRWRSPAGPMMTALLSSEEQWNRLFGYAAIPGDSRASGPTPALFDQYRLLVLAHEVTTPADPQHPNLVVESLTNESSDIVLRYKYAAQGTAGSAKFNDYSAIMLSREDLRVPQGGFRRIKLYENGSLIAELCHGRPGMFCPTKQEPAQ